MTAADCLQILREIKDVAFATVDEQGRPQVRIIDVMLIDAESLYFCTSRGKDFYRQLTGSGLVALTGMNQAYQMVRLNGRAKKLPEQKEWIDRIFEANPSMNAVYPGDSRYVLEPFRIDNGRLEFFDLGRSPIYRESFTLGGVPPEEAGYYITQGCIGCGACAECCPQRCIESGAPYRIQQNNCLHCGLCAEICPAQAIEKRSV